MLTDKQNVIGGAGGDRWLTRVRTDNRDAEAK